MSLPWGIDPNARRDIWEFLRARHKEGKTILLTTHYIEEAQHLCDRVMLIDNGMIFKEDTPQGLIDEIGSFKVEYDRGDKLETEFFSDICAAKKRSEELTIPSAYFRPPWKTSFSLYEQGGGRMEITTILWREWLFLKRRFWRITFSQMVSPLLYFFDFRDWAGQNDRFRGTAVPALPDSGLLSMTTMRK